MRLPLCIPGVYFVLALLTQTNGVLFAPVPPNIVINRPMRLHFTGRQGLGSLYFYGDSQEAGERVIAFSAVVPSQKSSALALALVLGSHFLDSLRHWQSTSLFAAGAGAFASGKPTKLNKQPQETTFTIQSHGSKRTVQSP
ncbi:MAG: hypothetical protein M1833_003345 [Piccolia ochrophora]|nr:MAG: hypothetical protein M1833_003345 [Piccolia ochrophora]